MPKTPACSPLKRSPVPRFTRSLLLSYADSPVQWSYVLPTDDTSDADEDDDELDIRTASPTEAPGASSQSPDTEASADEGSDRASARRNSWTSGSIAEASRSGSSVALRTLQSARQALVNAKRRSFELGERSVSVTFQQLRSCSLSSMRYSDNNDPGDATPGENNNANENSPSPAETINASSNQKQLVEQQEQTEPEQPEQEDLKQPKQQQQKKKKRRIRTASYQSVLTKYLPVVFNRSTSTKSKTTEAVGSVLNTNSSSASNGKNSERASGGSIDEEVNKHPADTAIVASPTSELSSNSSASHDNNDETNNETASDTEDGTDKQGTATTVTSSSTISVGKKFLRWPLRHHHYQNKEEPNDNQSEQSRSIAVSFVKQMQAESGK